MKKILAVLFAAFLLYVGAAALPQTLTSVSKAVREEGFEIAAVRNAVDGAYADMLPVAGDWIASKGAYINLHGWMAGNMGQRVMNEVIKLNNGWLYRQKEKAPEEYLRKSATSIQGLSERANGQYLYVQTPPKLSKYENQLPSGIEDADNPELDFLLACLAEYGVETMDFRDILHDAGIGLYGALYQTDHHWTPETGFFAAIAIAQRLCGRWGIQADVPAMDFANYEIETYPRWHMGSEGIRVGRYFSGVIDDYHLITPRFDTRIQNMETGKTGDFTETLVDRSFLQTFNVWDRMTYDGVYGRSFGWYRNLSEDAIPKKILLVTDSMGTVVAPFLILTFQEVYTAWRITDELLDDFAPDMIVEIRHPIYVTKTSVYLPFTQPLLP